MKKSLFSKTLLAMMVGTLGFSMVGCGDKTEPTNAPAESPAVTEAADTADGEAAETAATVASR